jgi:hypothetical protein
LVMPCRDDTPLTSYKEVEKMYVNGAEERSYLSQWMAEEFLDGNRTKASKLKRILDRWLIRKYGVEEASRMI